MRTRLLPACYVLLCIVSFGVARAGDGRHELSQASIDAKGGFPFVIDEPGSYVLTSDLTVPDGTTGLQIAAHQVNLDLNGFAIRGTHSCGPGGCSAGAGIGVEAVGVVSGPARDTTLRDGIVSGFGQHCVDLGASTQVEDLVVRSCGGSGIRAAEHSLVSDNRVSDCGGWGLEFVATAGYGGNVISNVDRLGSTGFIAGGTSSGGNLCDTGRCPGERRRYYLTQSVVDGDHGTNGCAAGFHMASIFEILDPSNLDYDEVLGSVRADSGSGPPGNKAGWARTGQSSTDIVACAASFGDPAWSSNSATDEGLTAALITGVTGAIADSIPRWSTQKLNCNIPTGLWCIED